MALARGKSWLAAELDRDRRLYGASEHHSLADAFRMPAIWLLAGVYITIQIGVYVVNLWMPTILDSLRGPAADSSLIARYSTLPYLLAAIFTVVAIDAGDNCIAQAEGGTGFRHAPRFIVIDG